jgi:hypothetical protein
LRSISRLGGGFVISCFSVITFILITHVTQIEKAENLFE